LWFCLHQEIWLLHITAPTVRFIKSVH
jgi:hypothetical protein